MVLTTSLSFPQLVDKLRVAEALGAPASDLPPATAPVIPSAEFVLKVRVVPQ